MAPEHLSPRKKAERARQEVAAQKHISDQLNTFTLGGSSAASSTNVATVSDPIHIQETSYGQLETMNLINKALFRLDGGPIPASSKIETTTVTDSNRATLFQAEAGSVYELNTAGVVATNPSSATYTMYISNAPSGGSDLLAFFYDASDDATVFFTDDANWGPFTIDENVRIEGAVGGTVDSATWQLHLYRIR